MFASLSVRMIEDQAYYRIEFVDGRTFLFSEYLDAIKFLDDDKYNYITNK